MKSPINCQPLIVLEGDNYHFKNDYFHGLFALISDKEIVLLKCVEQLMGEDHEQTRQKVFKPVRALLPNSTYKLVFLSKGHKRYFTWNNPFTKKEDVEWRTTNSVRFKKPCWVSYPKFLRYEYKELGCGPQNEVFLKTRFKTKEQVLIETIIMDLSTGKKKEILH